MPVEGSFEKDLKGSIKGFDYLLKKTANDGGEAYKDAIQSFTPVDTGRLRRSTKKSRAKKTGVYEYTVIITARTHYAKYIEYGFSPHLITAKTKKRLRIKGSGATPEQVFHPGYTGAHMFQKGTAKFRDVLNEPIMKKNLAIYLAAGKKGLRVS